MTTELWSTLSFSGLHIYISACLLSNKKGSYCHFVIFFLGTPYIVWTPSNKPGGTWLRISQSKAWELEIRWKFWGTFMVWGVLITFPIYSQFFGRTWKIFHKNRSNVIICRFVYSYVPIKPKIFSNHGEEAPKNKFWWLGEVSWWLGGRVMISFVGGPWKLGGPDFLWGDRPLCTIEIWPMIFWHWFFRYWSLYGVRIDIGGPRMVIIEQTLSNMRGPNTDNCQM